MYVFPTPHCAALCFFIPVRLGSFRSTVDWNLFFSPQIIVDIFSSPLMHLTPPPVLMSTHPPRPSQILTGFDRRSPFSSCFRYPSQFFISPPGFLIFSATPLVQPRCTPLAIFGQVGWPLHLLLRPPLLGSVLIITVSDPVQQPPPFECLSVTLHFSFPQVPQSPRKTHLTLSFLSGKIVFLDLEDGRIVPSRPFCVSRNFFFQGTTF